MNHKHILIAVVIFIMLGINASAGLLDDNFGQFFNGFLQSIVNAILYPFQVIISFLLWLVWLILGPIINFVASVYSIFQGAYSLVTGYTYGILPDEWLVLFGFGLIIRLFKFAHSYFGGISIAGFKI